MTETRTEVVLSLDISSSGVRARLHDRRLCTRAECSVELPSRSDEPGEASQRPQAVIDAVTAAVRGVIAAVAGADPSDPVHGAAVVGIAASGTASSFGRGLRAQGGGVETASDFLLWSDTRAAGLWPRLAQTAAQAYPRTLCPADASYWPAKLAWSVSAEPLEAATVFLGAKDFVFAWLTGRIWTDPMSAASTGVLDTDGWCWDERLACAAVRAGGGEEPHVDPSGLFPELRSASDCAPLLAPAAAVLGLEPGIPVAVGGMDGPLTQLGACGSASDVASCTVGTSIAYRANSDHRVVDPAGRVWCYPIDREHWVVGGAGNNGGNVVTWVRERLAPDRDLPAVLEEAFGVEPDPELIFVPYLTGERAPLWRTDLRAGFLGIRAVHRLGDLARACIDGVAAGLVELAAAVNEAAGEPRVVRVTGGFVGEPRWVQVMTDALGVRVEAPDPEPATSTGAAMVAWAAVERIPVADTFSPRGGDSWIPDPASTARIAEASRRLRRIREALFPGESADSGPASAQPDQGRP